MHQLHTGRPDPLALKPDPAKAAQACRALIRAYVTDPSDVEWSEVQDALAHALAAFQLSEDFIETEGGRWQ